MTEVRAAIDIAVPPERVWEVVQDPRRFGDWVTIHRGLKEADDRTDRVGAQMRQTMSLRGVKFDVRWELVAIREHLHAEWHGKGPARSHAETEFTLTPIADGTATHFTYRNVFHAPGGPLGAVASRALVGGIPVKEATASLERLKALLEGDAG
jgi:uncharacterized protein YndB with AHSA1/START domain